MDDKKPAKLFFEQTFGRTVCVYLMEWWYGFGQCDIGLCDLGVILDSVICKKGKL